ncbi:hypothetical protein, partial [uncultured Duncaniella sp.]|uniref:hypothetical protein n=1 Tax=uncultured Duncaniella sp. TaxID=2768039 RepID=UPI00259CCFB3
PNLTGQLKINLPLQFRNLALRNRIGSLAAWLKGRWRKLKITDGIRARIIHLLCHSLSNTPII